MPMSETNEHKWKCFPGVWEADYICIVCGKGHTQRHDIVEDTPPPKYGCTESPTNETGMGGECMRQWWLISIQGYGSFGFYGKEYEAEEARSHKSVWEGGVGRKKIIEATHPEAIAEIALLKWKKERGYPLDERELDTLTHNPVSRIVGYRINKMSENNKELIRHFPELSFTVKATVCSHYVTYVVYDIEAWGEGENGEYTVPLWHRKDATSHPDTVETLEEADIYLNGDVKWDGCSNWHFDEQDRAMLHGCSRAGVKRFGEIMAMCWDWTRELLPDFDGK